VNWIRNIIAKYNEVLIYLVFGGLTTLVNFLVYFPLYNWILLSAAVSNIIAWLFAVVFAFLTNKPFVFKSYDWSRTVVIPELVKFVGCRIGSGIVETVMIWLFADMLAWNGNWVKIITSIIVVIVNYVGSKWLVFKNNK